MTSLEVCGSVAMVTMLCEIILTLPLPKAKCEAGSVSWCVCVCVRRRLEGRARFFTAQ